MPDRTYPPARASDQVDDHFGELVPDPYRWLEDTYSSETGAWVKAENELTESWLASVPSREEIRTRLTELSDYPRFGVPFPRGPRWFQMRNSGLQDQPVLYVMDRPDDTGHVLLDPNTLSADGTVAVTGLEVTEDGSKLAYATSSAGSDWKTWRVRDVGTGADLDDTVEWSKFASAAWTKDNSGFFYSALEPPREGAEFLDQSRLPRILFHLLGTPQSEDETFFAAPGQDEWLPHQTVSDDGRYLVVSISRGTNPEARLQVLDLEDPHGGYRMLVGDFASKAAVVTNLGTTFYLLTDHGAERQRVVAVDLDEPDRDRWREVVPETDANLVSAYFFGGRLVCHYLQHATSLIRVYELDGSHAHDIALPPTSALAGSKVDVEAIEGRPDSSIVHFQLVSFGESGSLWSHDLSTGETLLVRASKAPIEPGLLVTEQVFVTSDDGTRIPVFLAHRRDVSPNGDVPALLYGYGGFDVPITPEFSARHALWMERGGLLAVAVLRGGGEYGGPWHDAGRLAKKQNVFDDFCACARWLAHSGWSRRERIAINGASNGGLLVGACMTQHPELFGAAVAEVGVLDMLRFHKFTIGWAWTSDFGDPENPEQYRWLRVYSPLQNVRPGEHYPATLLLTGDHDDRVVPGHSFKFAAALQAAQAGDAPILIRVETSTGHGAGKPTTKLVAESTDVLAFLEAVLPVRA
jgi:prolyl oligopeptidase